MMPVFVVNFITLHQVNCVLFYKLDDRENVLKTDTRLHYHNLAADLS